MKYQYAIDALLTHQLKATDPSTFNDPFDCIGTCHGELGVAAKAEFKSIEALRWALSSRTAMSNKLRVLSFVDGNVNDLKTEMLLWSHYADSGKGMRIAFDFGGAAEFSRTPTKIQNVNYCDNIPSLDLDCYERDPHSFNLFLEECIWTKGTSWAYECEVRLVAMLQALKPMPKTPWLRCVQFDPKCVKEIVFGPSVSVSDMEGSLNAIDEACGDSVAIGKAIRNDKAFRYDYIWHQRETN